MSYRASSAILLLESLAFLTAVGCSDGDGEAMGKGGSNPTGTVSTGGLTARGGVTGLGGTASTGGSVGSGGAPGTGGSVGSGGAPGTGGTFRTGGITGSGGTPSSGGAVSSGGRLGSGGSGKGGAAGATATGGSTGPIDCEAAMPGSGGTQHCGSDKTGKAGSLNWELWSNANNGNDCITYYTVPAFSAKWSNNNDFLARLGIEWGGKSIASLGEITAEFTYKKTGKSNGFSYVGVYGWATSPCVEYYIIDDSLNTMPFSPWSMQGKGSATIDGEVYKFYSGSTNGTGGSRCPGGGSFQQYWSVRQKGRPCGVINVTKHFEEWAKVGMKMDNILEAKVLIETGGDTGSIEFPIANVKAVK